MIPGGFPETSGSDARAAGRIRRLALLVVVALLASRVILLPVLAWNSRYVMDEYTQASYPLDIPTGFYRAIDPIKTVLYIYVFDVSHRLTRDAVALLHVARLEGALLAFLAAAALFGMSRRLGRGRFESLFSVGVLFSFTNFMERSFRIRSDTVAVAFAAAAVLAALGGEGLREAVLAGGLAGGAFLSTQKAIYPVAGLGIAVALSGLGVLPVRRQVSRVLAYLGGFSTALLAYAVWFDCRHPFRVLSMVFLSPLRFAPLHGNPFYAGIRERYITQTLVRNPVSYAICVLGLAFVLASFRSRTPRVRLAAVSGSVITLLVFTHEQPWPYVFVMALPFLALFAPDGLALLEARAAERGPWVRLAVCALLALQLPRNIGYLSHGNGIQNEVVAYTESLLGPGDRYFDGIGMVPTRRPTELVSWEAMVLAGVRTELERGDTRSITRILDGKPKVWILNYRIHSLREFLPGFLDPSYVRVHPDLLLTGAYLPGAGSVTFVNRWPGRYALYRPDGSPGGKAWTVDGRAAPADGFLPAGRFELGRASPDGPRYLLPAGVTLPMRLPVTTPLDDLFAGVYD